MFIRQSIPYYAYEDFSRFQILLPPKINYYRTHPEINTLFVGSSLVYHQIIPDTFDIHTNLKSLNLGVNGMVFFESSYFLEQFLLEENLANIDFVFFEVSSLSAILHNSLKPIRPNYFLDLKRTALAIKLCYELNRRNDIFPILKGWAYRFLGINNLKRLMDWNAKKEQFQAATLFYKGFAPLTYVFKEKTEFITCDHLISRSDNVLITKELNRLNKLCISNDITFIPIYINESFRCNQSDVNNIVLGDFGDYPEYEETTFWFGPGHMNEKGAKIFTKHFTNQFKNRFLVNPK